MESAIIGSTKDQQTDEGERVQGFDLKGLLETNLEGDVFDDFVARYK